MLKARQTLHDRYQLQEKLGQTAGRQTWLATDLSTTSLVIVKLLAFADQVNWETLKLFEREANILRHLDHPKIPKYRDYFSIDDRILWFGLVQDYIPGHSLKDLLNQGDRFSETQVTQIAKEVLDILIYLHQLSPPVLHRDIKPSNLIVGEDKHIYLIDFGAVQDRAALEGATFTVVGTYGYAPMEQFGGRSVPASDLYALGATLIHLLTGIAPADLPQKNLRITFSHCVSISAFLTHWIGTLTNPDLEQRFETAYQALASLQTQTALIPRTDKPQLVKSSEPVSVNRRSKSWVEIRPSPDQLMLNFHYSKRVNSVQKTTSDLGLVLYVMAATVASGYLGNILQLIKNSPSLSTSILLSCAALSIIAPFFLLMGVAISRRPSNVLIFNKQWIYICSKSLILGSFEKQTHLVSDFQGVFCIWNDEWSAPRHIILKMRDGSYSFGQGLSRQECERVVEEIRIWLAGLGIH
jgi:serine/threonine protein kinase